MANIEQTLGVSAEATFRVKKFLAGADVQKDEPFEVIERAVALTPEEASDIAHGRAVLDLNGDNGVALIKDPAGNVLAEKPVMRRQ